MDIVKKKLSEIVPAEYNPRIISDKSRAGLTESIKRFGLVEPIVWNKRTGNIVGGHQRYSVLLEQGIEETDVVVVDLEESEEIALNIALNNPAIQGDWNDNAKGLLKEVEQSLPNLFAAVNLDDLLKSLGGNHEKSESSKEKKPKEEPIKEEEKQDLPFVIPPFSVLDQRKVYWKAHRAEWIKHGVRGKFDPVLTSIIYKWFCPSGGLVVDIEPKDATNGLVAGLSQARYVGITEKNHNEIWQDIIANKHLEDCFPDITPIERVAQFWLKREDLFRLSGARGGKASVCKKLLEGVKGVVFVDSNNSPCLSLVASVAESLGVPCVIHTIEGETQEIAFAIKHKAEVIQHKEEYITELLPIACNDSEKRGFLDFSFKDKEVIDELKKQVFDLPNGIRRIVVPVRTGITLAGVLQGLIENGYDFPVLGVVTESEVDSVLDEFAPKNWREMVRFVKSSYDFFEAADGNILGDVLLDPFCEAKCLPFLEEDDLLWVGGVRESVMVPTGVPIKIEATSKKEIIEAGDPVWTDDLTDEKADLVLLRFNDEKDFDKIEKAASFLDKKRFAVAFCDNKSRMLMSKIIESFDKKGLRQYNEAVFVQDLPWCVKSSTDSKNVHSFVIVFYNGLEKSIKRSMGTLDLLGMERSLVLDKTENTNFVELD